MTARDYGHLDLERELKRAGSPAKAAVLARFFKTRPGEYGEGDQFLGLTVPQTRAIIRAHRDLPRVELAALLRSRFHECRLAALLLLAHRAERGDDAEQEKVLGVYLKHTQFVNNWDLVDSSAPQIVGGYLLNRERSLLRRLARSASLWENRIAIVATLAFIRRGDVDTTFDVAGLLLDHPHDLIHKAVGWMLREAGKQKRVALEAFLDRHAQVMPRTMLRYAIERFESEERMRYMNRPVAARTAQRKPRAVPSRSRTVARPYGRH